MRAEGITAAFDLDENARWRLLNGLDDICLTLQNEADIAAYEAARPSYKPQDAGGLTPGLRAPGEPAGRVSATRSTPSVPPITPIGCRLCLGPAGSARPGRR